MISEVSDSSISQLWTFSVVSPCILIRRERMVGGVCACSEVKLNRMGQAVQTAYRGGRACLPQLVLSPKCLELLCIVEPGVAFLAPATC